MVEDTILINNNVAYVCRNNAQHQQVNLSKDCSSESVPIEVNNNAMHKAANQQSLRLSDLVVDSLNVKLIKMKKLLVCVILLCAALVMITLTAIILSALSYRFSQTRNEHPIQLTEGNDTIVLCNIVPQDTLQLHKYIQTQLDSLQIQLYCGAGQWHRIAFLNMTDPSQQCPSAWREYNTSGVRACGRPYSTEGSCLGVT